MTVLEFLEFLSAKSRYIKTVMSALHPIYCPLFKVAATARWDLRSSPILIPQPINLTKVVKQVHGGLWYIFATAKLLNAMLTDMNNLQEHRGSMSTL